MPYCERCDKDYPIGTLFCPKCGLYLLEFKIKGHRGFKNIQLETIAEIYRWANESVAEKGSIDWEALERKVLINIGATREKAKEYIEIVKRFTEDGLARRAFERSYRIGIYEHIAS